MNDTAELLSSAQVAELFDVHPKTPSRWARDGILPKEAFIITPGGRYKFREAEIRKFLEGVTNNG